MKNVSLNKNTAFSHKVIQAESISELHSNLESSFLALGFDYFKILNYLPFSTDPNFPVLLTNWDIPLGNVKSGTYSRYESCVANIIDARKIVSWASLADLSLSAYQGLADFAKLTGMHSGIILPLAVGGHLQSGSILFSTRERNVSLSCLNEAFQLSVNAHLKLSLLNSGKPSPEITACPVFSERQIAILTWMSEGKSNVDIATILSISRRAVDYHVGVILSKFGVTSRTKAVALFQLKWRK